MDSLKFFKGYGKVEPSEHQTDQTSDRRNSTSTTSCTATTTTRKRLVAVAISSVVLLTVIIAAVVGALIHESVTEPPEPPSPSEAIRAVCSVTQYPESCFASISSFNGERDRNNGLTKTTDPELIFNLSLRVAVEELRNLSSLPRSLISKSNDPGSEAALKDCATVFDDAASQLNESLAAMDVVVGGAGEKKVLTEGRIGDLRTWISAAMTDQETCLDGLEETGSTVLDEVRSRVQRSKEYMSNSLAILSNIKSLLDKFDLSMH